jgi:hypothetical protein
MPTDDQLIELIITEVGDDGTVANVMDTIWALYSPYALYQTLDGRHTVQYLYAKIKAIDVMMGRYAPQFTFAKRDRKLELGNLFKNWKDMREIAQRELDAVLSAIASVGGVSVADMDAYAAPQFELPSGSLLPDPNDSAYNTGNPLRPTWAEQST